MNTERLQRADDNFMRRLLIVMLGIIVTQGIAGLIMVGYYGNSIETNMRDINLNRSDIKSNRRSIDEFNSIKETVTETNTHIKLISLSLNEVKKSMYTFGKEQSRRESIVNRADRFMTDHEKEHARQK